MRHILRGFTMYVGGVDYGYEVEELQIQLPTESYTEHTYGGGVMTASVPMVKVEALEPTMKLQSHNPTLNALLMRPMGMRDTFTFRGAMADEFDGKMHQHVYIYEGRLGTPSPDNWTKAEKAGIGYTIRGIWYFRYEVDNDPIHEVGLFPARMRVNRIDLLTGVNDALGR